jgi:Rv2175c C-terminal domain of unknown function
MSDPAWPDISAQIELISVAEAAAALGVTETRVSQYLRDGMLVGLRRPGESPVVPALLLQGQTIVKGLPGTVTLLRDAGYADHEIVAWLFRADDSLPGTPIQALRENRGREVKRRAQVAGY